MIFEIAARPGSPGGPRNPVMELRFIFAWVTGLVFNLIQYGNIIRYQKTSFILKEYQCKCNKTKVALFENTKIGKAAGPVA